MPLEGKTSEGYSILYGRLIDFDPSHYVYNDCMKLWNMITDLWLREKGTTKGHVFVVDVSGILLGHAGRISPMGLKKYLTFLQEALPVRLKGLHFTNSIPVMEIILNMMKPFMKKELMDIVIIFFIIILLFLKHIFNIFFLFVNSFMFIKTIILWLNIYQLIFYQMSRVEKLDQLLNYMLKI